MKNLKIGVRLGIGFGITVLLLIVIAVLASCESMPCTVTSM